MGQYKTEAKKGHVFVCTEYGYNETPDNIKVEREVGKPVKGYEYSVPTGWINKGYVREVKEA